MYDIVNRRVLKLMFEGPAITELAYIQALLRAWLCMHEDLIPTSRELIKKILPN